MADAKEIPPYRCTSCLQAIPEDQEQHLFGTYGTRPRSDEADNFVSEAQNLTRYAHAVAVLCHAANLRIIDEVLVDLHELMAELTEEALRRLDRAQEALAIVAERQKQAAQAGVAMRREKKVRTESSCFIF